jgi:hypothetical protein
MRYRAGTQIVRQLAMPQGEPLPSTVLVSPGAVVEKGDDRERLELDSAAVHLCPHDRRACAVPIFVFGVSPLRATATGHASSRQQGQRW